MRPAQATIRSARHNAVSPDPAVDMAELEWLLGKQ
jgi:hypothetical protein